MSSFRRLFAIGLFSAVFFWGSTAQAGVAEGKKVFAANNCASCHQVEGPAKEKTIKDQLAKKGPELWYSGSKFKAGFLEKWLANPQPIRPLAYNSVTEKNKGDHPRLSPKDSADVAAFLMGLKSRDVKPLGLQAAENPRGRIIFIKKQSCYGCHSVRVRGKMAGGFSGPTFAGVSERLNPDWVYAYLKSPKIFKPVKMMPVYSGILNETELKELASYICSLN